MLIPPEHWKMIRCAQAHLGEEWMGAPLYYVHEPRRTEEEMKLACQALQASEYLPWPSERCVIVSVGWPYRNALSAIARRADTDHFVEVEVRAHSVEYSREEVREGNLWAREPDMAGPAKVTVSQETCAKRMDVSEEQWVRSIAGMVDERTNPDWPEEIRSLVARMFTSIMPCNSRSWVVSDPVRNVNCLAAFRFLYTLAVKQVACGYEVAGRVPRGYGTKRQRRLTENQRVYTNMPYDRVYNSMAASLNGGMGTHTKPHHVSGHRRNLWWKSGVDRVNDLQGMTAYERLLLSIRLNVPHVYVQPYWTGPREWSDDHCHWEISTEVESETRMPDRPTQGRCRTRVRQGATG
jgi:hypothetical protein